MKNYFLIIFIILATLCAYVSGNVFKSMRDQYFVEIDLSSSSNRYTYNDIHKLFSLYPNLSVTTIPLNAFKAFYYFKYQDYDKALQILDESINHNPHIFYVENVKARIFAARGQMDSAIFYSKKAFYGWPKNIDHFKFYTDLLSKKGDTTEILNAFGAIDSIFYDRKEYGDHFINTLASAKLKYIANYNDLTLINIDSLYGQWTKVLEFENRKFVSYEDFKMKFTSQNYISDNQKYLFNLRKDSLFIYPISNPKLVLSKYQILYSVKYKTLILKNYNRNTDKINNLTLKKLNN